VVAFQHHPNLYFKIKGTLKTKDRFKNR